jgi:hypothetical protein
MVRPSFLEAVYETDLNLAWEAVHEFGNEDYLRREDDPDLELKTWEA